MKQLYILWTNADPITSRLMVMMYAKNSMIRHWWDAVTVILWGATTKLAAEDAEIQAEIRQAKQYGVRFTACVTCAGELDVTGQLEEQGIELKAWGPPLTELIQQKEHLITI